MTEEKRNFFIYRFFGNARLSLWQTFKKMTERIKRGSVVYYFNRPGKRISTVGIFSKFRAKNRIFGFHENVLGSSQVQCGFQCEPLCHTGSFTSVKCCRYCLFPAVLRAGCDYLLIYLREEKGAVGARRPAGCCSSQQACWLTTVTSALNPE